VTGAPSKKPWWVIAYSRKYALFLAIFYLVFGCFWTIQGLLVGRWWDIAIGALWLLLDVAAWATVWWFRHRPAPGDPPGDGGGAS
jgi:hypothetical protein